jgi:hypothetical protein
MNQETRNAVDLNEYESLMDLFSRPRPNGSRAEEKTSKAIQEWLRQRGIPFRVHSFAHYPYFFECIGAWLIVSRLLLAAAIWLRWGGITLPIALVALAGATLDQAFHWPIVTWPGRKRGENIIIEIGPENAECEVIFSAHYDSKTELMDHNQRMFFLYAVPLGIILTVALGILGPLDQWFLQQGSAWAEFTHGIGILLSLPLLFLAGGLGANMLFGRLVQPSQGTIDNGASSAILLGLAAAFYEDSQKPDSTGKAPELLQRTRFTLPLFTGEEVDRQGSRAYVRWRKEHGKGFLLPAVMVNMEAMGQDGDYVFWERDGSIFHLAPTSEPVNAAIRQAVIDVTGKPPVSGGPMISDGAPFLLSGIPTSVIGTYHSRLRDSGFHRPSDNRTRVVIQRLPEGVEIMHKLAWILVENIEKSALSHQEGTDPV